MAKAVGVDPQQKFSGSGAIRSGHEIDVARLERYLTDRMEGFFGPLQVEQFHGGQSCPTYKLITPNHTYVLRRKPPGKLLPSAHAVDREYRAITALWDTPVPVPRTWLLCEDEEVAGTVFYVMDFLQGRIIWDPLIPGCSNDERAAIYDAKNATLAALHSVNFEAVGLGDFGKQGNYVARQVSRWSKQYIASETETIEEMNCLIEWLPENIPEEDPVAIVHGDYRLDNMVLHPTESRVLGVLDWELCTLGNPLPDFAYHCMLWETNPDLREDRTCHRLGIPTQAEYIASYCDRMGRDEIAHWDFYMAYNIFRSAAILQGIVGRVRDGTASNVHAAERAAQVRPIAQTAWQMVQDIR